VGNPRIQRDQSERAGTSTSAKRGFHNIPIWCLNKESTRQTPREGAVDFRFPTALDPLHPPSSSIYVRVLVGPPRVRAVRKAYTIVEARMAYGMIV
jgi:hypothetical protein